MAHVKQNRTRIHTTLAAIALALTGAAALAHSTASADSDDSQRALMLRLVQAQETQARAMQEIARSLARCR